MIKAKIRLYEEYNNQIEFAEVQQNEIIEKTRFEFNDGDSVYVFGKVHKDDCVSKYAYVVMSLHSCESATIDINLVEFDKDFDEDLIPIIG